MFEKFGELNSVEELNKAAAGLKEEGDVASLIVLAEENGLDKEDAEDYAAGEVYTTHKYLLVQAWMGQA